jgi:transcriptional regulator with XRE-family HTH domain
MKDISYFGGISMNCKYKINKKATGLKLYRLISKSKYTYAQIAEFLDLQSPRVVYDWLNGIKLPSTENLYNLANLFHVQIEDILEF